MTDPAIYLAVLGALAGSPVIAPLTDRATELVVIVEPDADGVIRMAATVPGGDIIYSAAAADSDRERWLTQRVEVDDRGSEQGDALIELGAGPDLVRAGEGFDLVKAGCGNDVIHGGQGEDILYGGCDSDTLYGGLGDDDLFGGRHDDRLRGQDGDDNLRGQKGGDDLDGGRGDDILNGGPGWDRCTGGPGADLFIACEVITDYDHSEGDQIVELTR